MGTGALFSCRSVLPPSLCMVWAIIMRAAPAVCEEKKVYRAFSCLFGETRHFFILSSLFLVSQISPVYCLTFLRLFLRSQHSEHFRLNPNPPPLQLHLASVCRFASDVFVLVCLGRFWSVLFFPLWIGISNCNVPSLSAVLYQLDKSHYSLFASLCRLFFFLFSLLSLLIIDIDTPQLLS